MTRLFAGLLILLTGRASTVGAQEHTSFPTPAIGTRCIEFADLKPGTGPDNYRECRVSESGQIGTVANRILHFALYCIVPNWADPDAKCGVDSFQARYHSGRGLGVFAQDAGQSTARLLFARAAPEVGVVYYEKPQLYRNPAGTILQLPVAIDGTGHGNSSEYYLAREGGWERLESDTWVKEVVSRLPPGVEIWKGIWPDLETMKAETGLYRAGDGNCCPTGGVARIRLGIQDGRFVVDSLIVEKPR